MRVLHLLKTSVGATWALRQMRELVKLGVDVHVALPEGPLVGQYEYVGVTTHIGQFDLPIRSPGRWRSLFGDFRELVDSVKPDLIHSHFVGTTLTMRFALRKSDIPRIFQVPGPLHLEQSVIRRAEIASGTKADYWIGSCKWTCQRYLDSGISGDRVFLSYYGTDIEMFTPQRPGTLREMLGIDQNTPVVGMVAYMYAPKRFLGQKRGIKGHEDLIDALKIVQRSLPDAQLVVIGGAWAGAMAYEERVRQYGKIQLGDSIHFLGTRTDVPELYADIDVVAHPSHSENVGGAAESLLLGVPTVTSSVGGFPDLVKPSETGWLVPPKSPHELAAAILEALIDQDRANDFAENGQVLARTLMDVRKSSKDVLRAYRTILGLTG